MLKIKRVYDDPMEEDGFRVLVDRLWPRGLAKSKAKVDLWLKDIAPSNELRKWFSHDPKKWGGFRRRYLQELKQHAELSDRIKQLGKDKATVTLLYSAQDERHNNAIVLLQALRGI